MAIDKEVKKKIVEDWLWAFPELSMYAKDKLYKVVGPIVMGIELIKLPRTEEYRPHFVIYPLWKDDVNKSLDAPIILHEYYNKKALQYSIPYNKHDMFFADVLESIKKQTLLPFENNIPLKMIMNKMDYYSRDSPLSAAPNSYLQAAVNEAKLKTALYIDIKEAQRILEQIKTRNWDVSHFAAWGINVNEWLKELAETISNRGAFLKQIEINKQDKKIAKLKASELIF